MRKFLLTILFTAIALPIFAKDSGDAAFDILRKYTPETQQTNYIKLQSTINLSDAKRIDAQISELYGNPRVTREGLKVWEVKNNHAGGSDQTTIMCGPDGNGGVFISADRRGSIPNGAATKSKRAAQRQSPILSASNPKSKTSLRPQERD